MRKKILLILFLVCGQVGAVEKIRVACIGDSITSGYKVEHPETNSYPARLQQMLGDRYEVRNFGNPGRGIIKSSKRGEGWRAFIKQKEHRKALDFNPDVVICNLGINDIMDYRAGHAAEFIPDYLELIRAYQKLPSKPKIFIWTKLAPLFESQKYYGWEEPFVMRLDLEKVAAETGAIGLDMFSGLVGRSALFQDDAIHPNAEGYKEVAQLTYEQIKSHLTGDFGGIKLPYVYGDHMVLQRQKELRIQGTANAGQAVTVHLAGKKGSAMAGQNGRWEIRLPPMEAGGPYRLEVEAEKTLCFEDVMIGEVWIAAGQSNMELPLNLCWGGKKEISQADDPNRRLLDRRRTIPKGKVAWDTEELAQCSVSRFYGGRWERSSPESISEFSGVAYFFAQQLRQELKVPVGIIHVAIGGAPVEAFMGEDAMLANPHLRPEIASNGYWFNNEKYPDWVRGRAKKQLANWIEHPNGLLPGHPFAPSFLYRSAIQPLDQLPIRGVIWYQGESNAALADPAKAVPYEQVYAGLETLILDWRRQFAQGDFPFLYVQLPNYAGRNWMTFRQMQLDLSRNLPNLGMAVAIDVGDPCNVHPKNKRPVGDRLARLALAKTYGMEIPYSGPAYRTLAVEESRMRVFFDFADGLQPAQGTDVTGFEVSGEDGVYHRAEAKVEGDSVILHSGNVPKPVAVRYGWESNPDCNLVNSAHLPTSPFRAIAFPSKAKTLKPSSE